MHKSKVYTHDRTCDEMVQHQVPYWFEFDLKDLSPAWLKAIGACVNDELLCMNKEQKHGTLQIPICNFEYADHLPSEGP